MAKIDIFVCVTAMTSEYADLTKEISSKLLSNKHNINWKYIISGSVKKNPREYEYISTVRAKKKVPLSFNHGMALNEAFEQASENYVIMLDTDFIFLMKNWDDVIVRTLDKGYAAFGADSPLELNRAYNFPFVYCFCYKKDELGGTKLDFLPMLSKDEKGVRDIRLNRVKTKREQDVTGMPLGKSFRWETSSRIPFIFYDNNLKSKAIKVVLGGSPKAKLPFINSDYKKKYLISLKKSKANRERMAEWHYKGKLFGTHLRLGTRFGMKDKVSRYWVKRIKSYLKAEYNL